MPVKRRATKRRGGSAEELDAWGLTFSAGYDFFESLPEIGVPIDQHGRPDRATAEEAWHRLGAQFLAEYRPRHADPWALSEFGEPHAS